MRLSSGSERIINRKKLAKELAKKYGVSYNEVRKAIKSQTLMIEEGMMANDDEWDEVFNPIRVDYVGLFKPVRKLHVEKRAIAHATNEIQARIKAKKELNEFLKRKSGS